MIDSVTILSSKAATAAAIRVAARASAPGPIRAASRRCTIAWCSTSPRAAPAWSSVNGVDLPDSFELQLDARSTMGQAEVAWRDGAAVGVKLDKPK